MPNVNLIAARRAEKKRLERNTRRLLLGITVEGAAVAVLAMTLGVQQMQVRTALVGAEARVVRLEPALRQIEQIKADTAALQPKINTLRTARADTLRWRALLQIVSQSIPSNAYLSSITASAPSGGDPNAADPSAAAPPVIVALAGTAGSQTLVGETMSRLGAYPVFDQVELRFTQLDSAAATAPLPQQSVKFEIGARLKSSAPRPAPPAAGTPAAPTPTANNAGAPQQTAAAAAAPAPGAQPTTGGQADG